MGRCKVQILWAEQALTENGWQNAVRIEIGRDGRIADLRADSPPEGMRLDTALPAMGNVHSHAFQRAMAGLAESRTDLQDSFWSWRKLMYRFLEVLTPEDVENIAAFVQMEMAESGFAAVGEFHYLHHRPGGAPYANIAEMSERIFAAQAISGIGLAYLPVLYQRGGCDGRPLLGGQMRFGCDLDRFADLLDGARAGLAGLPADCILGMAPHSLRAVSRESLDHLPELASSGPIHMHIAEQQAEVVEVTAYFGARPVEWLLNIFHVDPAWCLIHATQMTPAETIGLAGSGAVAGLCPITESNLGDGIFDGVRYLDHGGRIALGSDSNIRISLTEEIRTLEYSQRLRDYSRAALAQPGTSTGRAIYEAATRGAAQALGRGAGVITKGGWADITEISRDHPDLDGLAGDTLLDVWLFAGDDRQVRNLWSAGRHLVVDGRHVRATSIRKGYRNCRKRLRALL